MKQAADVRTEPPTPEEERFVNRLLASVGKTRQRGLSWLIRRTMREISIPTSGPGHLLRNILRSAERSGLRATSTLSRALPGGGPAARKTLYFFVDLEVCPITFDLVTGIATAELYRRSHGLTDIHAVIVPGSVGGLREETTDYGSVVDADARRWRIHNLVIPLFRLLPTISGYTVCGTRREAYANWFASAEHVFPEGYSITFPTLWQPRDVADAARAGHAVLPMFRATPQALDYMRRFVEPRAAGRRVVVINLRRYGYMPGRNSNDANWYAFARTLDNDRWMPLFVLDTNVALDPKPPELDEFVVCDVVPFSIELRMALYEVADLVMAVTQGPMELCWLNDHCSYASFVKPGSSIHTTDETYLQRGYDIGKGPPFMTEKHRWVWDYDELPVIRAVFEEMTGG